jgi:hypothetical protein
LAGAGEREGDEDGMGGGEAFEGLWRVGGRVEDEFQGAAAAGGCGCAVGNVVAGEEGDQEGGGPAGAEDEHRDGVGAWFRDWFGEGVCSCLLGFSGRNGGT